MKNRFFAQRAIIMLALLALQFTLGMFLNLFVKLPNTHPGTTGNDYFARIGHSYMWGLSLGGGTILLLHILVATGLLIGSVVLMILAIRSQYKVWRITYVLGFVGVLGALFNGLSFISYYHDFSSFIMALGYIIATLSYATGLYLSQPVSFRKVM